MNLARYEIMLSLGGCICKHCGIDDYRLLEIDHIFGNGKEMPLTKSGIRLYYLENPDIAYEELQVLCCNCHRIKGLENGDIGRRNNHSIEFGKTSDVYLRH